MIVTVVFNALCQGTLIFALAALLLRFVSLANAKTRYAMYFITLLALVAVPILTTTMHVNWGALSGADHAKASGRPSFTLEALAPLSEGARRWINWPALVGGVALSRIVLAVWVLGALAGLLRLVRSYLRIADIRRSAYEYSRVDDIPVLLSAGVSTPIAMGINSPAIVLPAALVETVNASELRCAIQHELAHVRRGDIASNALVRVIEAIFFWNPWIRFTSRRLELEREIACDDWAVRRLGRAEDYAACLAVLARQAVRSERLALTAALGSSNGLIARIERLLSDRPRQELQMNYFAIGGTVMLFAAATILLQALLPMQVEAGVSPSQGSPAVVAAGPCRRADAPPQAINPAPPHLPKSEWPTHKVTTVVTVTVEPNGKARETRIYHSSGNPNVDRAVLAAAASSTYSPKLVNCTPVEGTYLFKADFAP